MNTIKLNNVTLELESYGRSTSFNGAEMESNANCDVITSNINALFELAQLPITTLQIYHDNNLVYDLQNINCVIASISEFFNGERMNISLSLKFTME